MWSSKRLEGFFNYQGAPIDSSTSLALEPSVASLQPSVAALQPSVAALQPSVAALEPSVAALEPSVAALQPSVAPTFTFDFSSAPSETATVSYGSSFVTQPTSDLTDQMTLTSLQELVRRIDQETMLLNNLPDATNPNIIAKRNQLALLRTDLNSYIAKLQTTPPQILGRDIPISFESMQAFLQSLGSPSATTVYPGLFNTAPASAPVSAPVSASAAFPDFGLSPESVQDIFKGIQDIKWRFELSYDPALSQKTDLLDRLESLEKRIMAYSQSGTPMPDSVKQVLTRELDLITSIIKNSKQVDIPSYKDRQQSQQTRMQPAASYKSDGRTYSIPERYTHGSYGIFDGVPRDSPDVRVRPGFVMTDEQIRHRGSAAAFNTQIVGGADYKKRAEELCGQIRGANIGAPVDFGCIENPGEVSANYSWKGNYTMVCNRLGDTWGSWYPEMFGCPKYNPDDQYNGKLL